MGFDENETTGRYKGVSISEFMRQWLNFNFQWSRIGNNMISGFGGKLSG